MQGVTVLSFNCLHGMSFPVHSLVSWINSTFSTKIGTDIEPLICPLDPRSPDTRKVMLRHMDNLSLLLVSFIVSILMHIKSSSQEYSASGYYFDLDGNFVVYGSLGDAFVKLIPKFGITFSGQEVYSEVSQTAEPAVRGSDGFFFWQGQLLTGLMASYIHMMLRGGASSHEFASRVSHAH